MASKLQFMVHIGLCFSAAHAISLRKGDDGIEDSPLVNFNAEPSLPTVRLSKAETATCAVQNTWDNYFMSDVLKSVGMGNFSTDLVQAWNAYQDKLKDQLLREHPDKRHNKPLKILVVSAVHDAPSMVEIFETNMKKLNDNKARDEFEFALFHHDSSNTEWKGRKWYNSRRGQVVHTHLGPGCKPQFWADITPKMASSYDYIWLLDEDISLDFLNWDLYRTVLSTLEPLVSQPVIIPKAPHKRATGVTKLNMAVPSGNTFPIAYETQRSEVQAPIISAKIWAAIHERNMGNDRTNDWYIDDFWDVVALASKVKCHGSTAVLAVNAAPVRHMDCHNLFRGTKCTEGCGANRENCRPVTSTEEKLVHDALKETSCDVSKGWSDMCKGKEIHDCHLDLWAKAPRKTWNAQLDA